MASRDTCRASLSRLLATFAARLRSSEPDNSFFEDPHDVARQSSTNTPRCERTGASCHAPLCAAQRSAALRLGEVSHVALRCVALAGVAAFRQGERRHTARNRVALHHVAKHPAPLSGALLRAGMGLREWVALRGDAMQRDAPRNHGSGTLQCAAVRGAALRCDARCAVLRCGALRCKSQAGWVW